MTSNISKQQANNKRCIHELRGALPPVVYNYICGCKTAQDIWKTLKEKFQRNEYTKKILVNQCLSELADVKKKET